MSVKFPLPTKKHYGDIIVCIELISHILNLFGSIFINKQMNYCFFLIDFSSHVPLTELLNIHVLFLG